MWVMQTVTDIIKEAGGVNAIARHLTSKARRGPGPAVDAASTVYKWKKSGIPERHWPLVMRLAKVSITKIFAANQRTRELVSEASSEEAA